MRERDPGRTVLRFRRRRDLPRARGRRLVAILAGSIAMAALAGFAVAWRPALPIVAPRPGSSFDLAGVERGAVLARLGDCAVCHTASGGAAYAGGRPIHTPFGTLYASNITPDPESGIGRWSQRAFDRAMRRGVARDGSLLYPAFPFTHYTGLADRDLGDLYAFLMTRTPVAAARPDNRLVFPLGFRPLMAGWDLLFFRPGRTAADPARTPDWNRGRYLAESLSHCGACHTPRNLLGAEERGHAYAGGWSDGWYAPPLDASSPARRAWTADRLFAYLRTGLDRSHAAAAGPMGPVAYQLARVPDADVRAIAVYVAFLMARPAGDPAQEPERTAEADASQPEGAALFAGACASCHGAGAPMMLAGRPALALGTPLHEHDPRDVIEIVLQGLNPPTGAAGPYMPAFGDSLTDGQVAAVVAYLRARYGGGPAWPDLPHAVRTARRQGSGA